MNPVIVRNIKIGEGIPKICVPIVGVTVEDIINEAKSFDEIPLDLVEWRSDWYEDVFEFEKVKEVLAELRGVLGDTPILFTFRTAKEGGEKEIEESTYLALNQMAAETGYADLIDVELFSGEHIVKPIIEKAHKNGVKVVASNHDFQMTPSQGEIVKRLQNMQELGADILKIAVMPQTKKDVLTLLSATEEMVMLYAEQPVVTMSMSGKGVISRLAGEVFGSAMTFGAAKKASAPGQIPVGELAQVLDILHHAQ
ncbi:MAG: type I 3-dehydroquinate dehydratase [Tyzzerella sp.]|nr:type I 3-dehydroquinate dehydratase [Tyzzerella sp.]